MKVLVPVKRVIDYNVKGPRKIGPDRCRSGQCQNVYEPLSTRFPSKKPFA